MQTKSAYLDKTIILEGCNGEWAQERYLPLLADRAAKGNIELWAIDSGDEIRLKKDKARKFWPIAQERGKAHYLHYLNGRKLKDEQFYNRLPNITHVFIVTPDRTHCQIANSWLERLAPNGKIFIEKPLDASMDSARELKRKISEKNKRDTVFVFDHYLAKAYPLLRDENSGLAQIGVIKKIKFNIVESSTILLNRAKTLNKGLIFDLFGHVLALSGALIERELKPSKSVMRRIEIKEVKAARYCDSLISEETFAWIKFNFDNVEVTSVIGKGISTRDNKFMQVNGTGGILKLYFIRDKFACILEGREEKSQRKLQRKHVETYLEELIDKDNQPMFIPGVLDFDTGLEVLTVIDKAKAQIRKIINYREKETRNSILKKF